jgi:HlyD family secretion protein
MKKTIFIPIVLCLLWSCSNNGGNILLEESGTIETTDVVLSSQTAGKVINLSADEGTRVKQGDTLLVIDHELLDLQLKQAEASADIAKAQLSLLIKGARIEDIEQAKEVFNQAQSNLKLAETDKTRIENLFNSGAATQKQLDDAVLRYDVVKSQFNASKENYNKVQNFARPEEITQAKANVSKSEAGINLLKKNIKDCFIISPINGIVVKRFVEAGETVSMLSSLLKVSNLSRVEVVIYVSEKTLPQIKLNQTAEIVTDGQPDKPFEGKVIFISPEAEFTPKNIQTKEERTKQVFAVKLEIDNKSEELKTGLPVDVRIKK